MEAKVRHGCHDRIGTGTANGPRSWCRLAVTALVAVTAPGLVFGVAATAADTTGIVNGLIVGFTAESSPASRTDALHDARATREENLPSIGASVVTPAAGQTRREVEQRLSADPTVVFVEPNYRVRLTRTPNDPMFGRQWSLSNDGDLGGISGADIGAQDAWNVTTGDSTTVAVIDTGIAVDHPDLRPNVWTNPADPPNGRDDDRNGIVDDVHGVDFLNRDGDPADDNGHGTHVSGTIAAAGDNGIGVAGVAWHARVMALKFLGSDGSGSMSDAVEAVDYAVDHGARVINASWGGLDYSQALYAAIARAGDRDVLFVAAAGNEGSSNDQMPEYPASFDLPNVISVASSDDSDRLSEFSNYGSTTVDLAAPGENILSTVPQFVDRSGYTEYSGTSMAAPHVTGAAVLYRSRFATAPAGQVRSAILGGVDRVSPMRGRIATGGRLDVANTLGVQQPLWRPDHTRPTPFRLLAARRRGRGTRTIRFSWQRSRDESGIASYRLYVDEHLRRVVRDPDGAGPRVPVAHVTAKLSPGRHRWMVRAVDPAGNCRTGDARRGPGHVSIVHVARR